MRLAINALSVRAGMAGGRTFAVGLARALVQSARGHEVLVVGHQSARSLFDVGAGGFVPAGRAGQGALDRIRYERRDLAKLLAAHGVDMLICPDGTLPSGLSCKAIAIFQNLIYFSLLNHPRLAGAPLKAQWYGRLQSRYFLRAWNKSLSAASGCVAVSDAAKAAFVGHYGDRANRIEVIHEGIDSGFTPGSGPDLRHPYLLGVGTLYPHKHFDRWLEILAHPQVPASIHLILAGADWHGEARRLRARARELGVEERFELRGACTQVELLQLYRGALCVGLFSEAESFGLPVAEAARCGTPALVANRSAMPEVGGEGALAIGEDETPKAAEFVRALFQDAAFRTRLRAAAQRSAERFDERAMGRHYWRFIEAVAGLEHAPAPVHSTRKGREAVYRALPTALQHVAVTYTGWQNKKLRHGAEFRRELAFLEQAESYSRMELEAVQKERLAKLLKSSYEHVPYYHDLFKRLRLTPADFRGPEDLRKLPVLEKAHVRQAGLAMVNQSLRERDRVAGHTSGSTGTPLGLVYDQAALATEFATVWRLRRRNGCDLDAWHATFAGRLVVPQKRRRPPYHRINAAGHQLLFSLYHLHAGTAPHYVRALKRRSLAYYSGYPSALEALHAACLQAQVELPYPLLALFTSSESLSAAQRMKLAAGFGVPVRDRYGCAEFCVSFTECEEGRYHLDSEFGVVEVEPLEEKSDRITGALLCTGLTNLAMPFIRYRVGDVVTVAKSSCPCGRKSLSAFEIDGRREDYVLTHDGVRLGRLDHLFKDVPGIAQSQIEQDQAGRIRIKIVRGPEFAKSDETKLLDECRLRMGDAMQVELEYTADIPRTASGKFRAVVNRLPEAQRYA